MNIIKQHSLRQPVMNQTTVLSVARATNFFSDLMDLLKQDDIQICQVDRREGPNSFLDSNQPHLIVLDCLGTEVTALTLCQEIRDRYSGLLVLVSDNEDRAFHILALDLGADASLPVSAGVPLVVANVKALLRRFGPPSPLSALTFGNLTIDVNRRDAFVSSQAVHLSTIEFQLIWYLAQKSGCVVSREEIYRELQCDTYNNYDRRVDVYMSRIRQKIGDDPASPNYLKTVRGVGYQFIGPET